MGDRRKFKEKICTNYFLYNELILCKKSISSLIFSIIAVNFTFILVTFAVAPSRGRELKSLLGIEIKLRRWKVAPSRGRELKFYLSRMGYDGEYRRPLAGA